MVGTSNKPSYEPNRKAMKRPYGLLLVGGLTVTTTSYHVRPQRTVTVTPAPQRPALKRTPLSKGRIMRNSKKNDPSSMASCFLSSLQATPSPFSTSTVWEAFQHSKTLVPPRPKQQLVQQQQRTGSRIRRILGSAPPTTNRNATPASWFETKPKRILSIKNAQMSSSSCTTTKQPTSRSTTPLQNNNNNNKSYGKTRSVTGKQQNISLQTVLDSAQRPKLKQPISMSPFRQRQRIGKAVATTVTTNLVDVAVVVDDVPRYAIFGLMLATHGIVNIVVSDPDLVSAAHWAATNAFLYTSLAQYLREQRRLSSKSS